MDRIMKKMVVFFTVCMVMLLGYISPASAVEPFTLLQITNNAADDTVPQISKNGDAVWVGPGYNGNFDIYVYDGVTKQTSILTNHATINQAPRINDRGDIVWKWFNGVEQDWNISLYTKATNTIIRISLPKDPNFVHGDTNPQLNNLGQVVYESQNLGTDYEIMFYDGTTVTQVTNNTLSDEHPMLNDRGDIVWMATVNSMTSPNDIYLRDGVTRVITNLTNSTFDEINPQINQTGDIVWSGYDGSYYQIYYYKRSTSQTTKLTSTSIDNVNPQINASGQIAWGTMSDTADNEIYFRNGLNGTNINISNASTHDDGGPTLNDNGWVAWYEDQGTAGTNDQIFLWDGTTKTRLTTDSYDHIFPDINNSNTVVWQGTGGAGTTLTDYEIFMAKTGLCYDVDTRCNDNNACTIDTCNTATGACVHTPIVCNDNNACTTDTCNPATGCVFTPIVCNDNNVCTTDSCNPATGCVYTPYVCNDGNLCTTDTCDPARGGCVYTPLPGINDNNACTVDTCNPTTGVITHTPLVCNDNNACTTDTCNTATGCVFTPLSGIDDGNACTIDTCNPATGVITHTPIVCNDNNICTTDTCNTSTGKCVFTPNNAICPSTTGNNFTMLDPGGNIVGGTNDVFFAWDGTKKTSVAVSGQISNALLSSACTFGGASWSSHDLAVYGPGTYTVYTACPAGSPGCGLTSDPTGVNCPVGNICPPITFTVKTGEIGVHMLFNWDGNLNIDVVNIMKPNAVFAPSSMWQGVCGANASCTTWGWMSYDWDLDGINGGAMVDGPFIDFSPNFNYNAGAVNLCCDAATRCNDNNACTTDTCNTATGACIHTPVVCNPSDVCHTASCDTGTGACVQAPKCNDNNLCTIDTCNTATGACTYTPKCNDNNACTTDSCNTATGVCTNTPIFCADNNPCTIDTCDTVKGCVFTPKCNDNNFCTTDTCNTATGACTYTPCGSGTTCNSSIGCLPTSPVISTGNNFTILASNGFVLGGTNDVKFTWDSTVQNVATFANGTGPSNATISSDEPLSSWLWYAKQVQVVGPGTYWVDLDGSGPGTNRYEVTIPNGQLGVHMLMDWGPTGQATSCGKTDCDVDIWMAWTFNGAFAAGEMFTGADDGTNSNGPALDDPYPLPFVIDGRPNASTKVWDLVSVDLAGRITTSAGVTVTNLPLNGIPGIPMKEGTTYNGASANFNVMLTDPCSDAATRCNDNNACTNDTCNPTTGACSHTTIVCNDGNACTTDTCDPAIGCVFSAPKNCNDNNACTLDFCSPITGLCYHSTITCNDNNVCTTDTCNTATGCVFTNNTNACTDNNACTQNDHCSNGACVPGTPVSCPVGSCNTATGCTYTSVSTTGNNFTMMANGIILGGTNDVKFTWDGTLQNATTFANGTGPSNATITSDEPFMNWLWSANRVQIVGPGTYWVDLDGSGPSTNRYEVTIPAGRIGAHLLWNWGATGQTTSCHKTDCDIDMWIAWDFNNAFMTGSLFIGADDGTTSNGPALDDPYPQPFVIDGKPNTGTTVWGLVSVDVAGRITNSSGGTVTDLPLNGIPGIAIKEGTYINVSPSFNLKLQ